MPVFICEVFTWNGFIGTYFQQSLGKRHAPPPPGHVAITWQHTHILKSNIERTINLIVVCLDSERKHLRGEFADLLAERPQGWIRPHHLRGNSLIPTALPSNFCVSHKIQIKDLNFWFVAQQNVIKGSYTFLAHLPRSSKQCLYVMIRLSHNPPQKWCWIAFVCANTRTSNSV